MRIVCWFSRGIASACATILAIQKYENSGREIVIACTDTSSEHPDSDRFQLEVEEKCFGGRKTLMLHSDKYADTWDVWEKEKFLKGGNGAPCTDRLKKKIRQAFEQDGDIQVFGYTADERHRAERLIHNTPEITVEVPLIELGWTKAMCFDWFAKYKILAAMMYRLGFNNNNCIGCVKGGIGYWNHIRKHFPAVFWRMAKLERELGYAICKIGSGEYDEDGKEIMVPIFLDELPPDIGRHKAIYQEDLFSHGMSCDFLCGAE